MIVATFVGGPRDGEQVALEDARAPLYVALPVELGPAPHPDTMPQVAYREVMLQPELTRDGWVLRWKEPPHAE